MTNIVDDSYANYQELLKLLGNEDASLLNWAHENFRRVLVLIMANYLENEVTAILKEFFKQKSGSDLVFSFIEKSMERQYHTYFDWKVNNANRFFALFGETFQQEAIQDVRSDNDLEEGIRAFLEIGQTRNILTHELLHRAYIGNKTAKEFYESFNKSIAFVEYLQKKLK